MLNNYGIHIFGSITCVVHVMHEGSIQSMHRCKHLSSRHCEFAKASSPYFSGTDSSKFFVLYKAAFEERINAHVCLQSIGNHC